MTTALEAVTGGVCGLITVLLVHVPKLLEVALSESLSESMLALDSDTGHKGLMPSVTP